MSTNISTFPSIFSKLAKTFVPLILIVVIWLGGRFWFPDQFTLFAGLRPDNLGVKSGQLAACPPSPNCVSSQSLDALHQISPIAFNADISPATVISELKKVITSLDRTKIIAETPTYLYAEFSTALMGFVDDVEFFVNEDKPQIEVRSASRLGESDLGLNRQRIESIRANFTKNLRSTEML